MAGSVTIKNEFLEATVLFYGATLKSLIYKGVNVVLSKETEDEYKNNDAYLGATVGRCANRIANGKFVLGGIEYDVGCNEIGRGHLHGGFIGSDKRVFTPVSVKDDSVSLALVFEDGEEGYPSKLETVVTYSLSGSTLSISYYAKAHGDTVYNPTNHSYFNLNGSGNILDHTLQIDAVEYLPVDEKMIPTEVTSVRNTPFDFTSPKPIGRDIGSDHEQIKRCGGYDHTFVLCGDKKTVLSSSKTGISMTVTTTMPSVQVYTGICFDEAHGKNSGVALETQFYPNTPNRKDFPSCVILKGEEFNSKTSFTFA